MPNPQSRRSWAPQPDRAWSGGGRGGREPQNRVTGNMKLRHLPINWPPCPNRRGCPSSRTAHGFVFFRQRAGHCHPWLSVRNLTILSMRGWRRSDEPMAGAARGQWRRREADAVESRGSRLGDNQGSDSECRRRGGFFRRWLPFV